MGTAVIKRNETVTAKWNKIACVSGKFVDPETGEESNVAEMLEKVYGSNQIFTLAATNKVETNLE